MKFNLQLKAPRLSTGGTHSALNLGVSQREADGARARGRGRRGEGRGSHPGFNGAVCCFRDVQGKMDKAMKKTKLTLVIGTSSWKDQFRQAITANSGDTDEKGNEILPSFGDYLLHFLSLFWKVLFAFVPPTEYAGGWLCFVVSIANIGLMTALIGDIASAFGCTVGLDDEITAITLVALGTSLPDTFASKMAAVNDKTADSSIGNVTGSNAVNVFLGLGLAWSVAAIVNLARGQCFYVNSGSLGFSVTVFCILAVVAVVLLTLKRMRRFGYGELGGPTLIKALAGATFILLWFLYVLLSILEITGYIG